MLMSEPPELSIVIPTYNEAENISELIEKVENALSKIPFEIIIVDDNSPDGTANIAETLNGKYGNIRVLRRPCKLGLGSAILNGFRNARSDVLAVLDADLQHPPGLLVEMYRKMCEGYNLIVASRYVKYGGVEGWSIFRKLVSLSAIKLAHLFFPEVRNVKDPMSGFFMVRKNVIECLKLDSRGFKVLFEILVKGKCNSAVEVPYTFKSRKKGRSKLDVWEIIRYMLLLIKLRVER